MNEVKRYGYLGIVEEEDGEVVKWEDYAVLKAERDALAAESEALKEAVALLLEDARRVQQLESNAGTETRINTALSLLTAPVRMVSDGKDHDRFYRR